MRNQKSLGWESPVGRHRLFSRRFGLGAGAVPVGVIGGSVSVTVSVGSRGFTDGSVVVGGVVHPWVMAGL